MVLNAASARGAVLALLLILGPALLGQVAVAGAQGSGSTSDEPPPSGPAAQTREGQLLGARFEAGLTGRGRGDVRAEFVFSPEFGLRLRPDSGLALDVSWGLAIAATSVAGVVENGGERTPFEGQPTRVDPGNPIVQIGYSGRVAENVHLEMGLGAAVPLAARAQVGADGPTFAERAGSEASHRAAMAMRGYWAPWRWAPERFALFVPLEVAADVGALTLEVQGALGVMVPVLGGRGVDPDVVVQLAAGLSGRLGQMVVVGGWLRGVGAPLGVTLPGLDSDGEAASEAFVFSAEPWVRVRVAPAEVSLRVVVNFNGADGVAGDRAPPVGVFIGVGGAVD